MYIIVKYEVFNLDIFRFLSFLTWAEIIVAVHQ